jgi:hypothetical protein
MLKKDPDVLRMLFEFGFITKAVEIHINPRNLPLRKQITMILILTWRLKWNDAMKCMMSELSVSRMELNITKQRMMLNKLGLKTKKNLGLHHGRRRLLNRPHQDGLLKQVLVRILKYLDSSCPPNAYLDLEYVYGYRCHDVRNNLRYGNRN